MKNFKSTKRALLSSVMALILCFTMLLGTTFAWFTDSVTSNNNIIKAGNLDIELYYQVEGQEDWTKVTDQTNIFTSTLWEPGHTEVVKLKVVNEGTLALKYQLGVNVAEETGSVNVNGQAFKLSDYIEYGILDGAPEYANRDEAVALVTNPVALNSAYNSGTQTLAAKNDGDTDEKVVTMVVYMPTTVGNEANAQTGAATPEIKLGINLFATQVSAESDSFGSDYDNDAWHPDMEVTTGADLQAALNNGVTNIALADDIVLEEPIEIPAPADSTYSLRRNANAVVIDLNGKSITAGANGYVIMNANGATVVLMDTQNTGVVTGVVYNEVGNKMTIDGGTYNAVDGGKYVFLNCGEMVINDAVVNGGSSYPVYSYGDGHNLVINDITVSGPFGCVNAYGDGTVTINDGEYTATGAKGKTHHCVYVGTGTELVINDGTFAHNGAGISDSGATLTVYAGENGGATINGGTFTGSGTYIKAVDKYDAKCYLNIKGGTFSTNVNSYVVSGYKAEQVGNTWVVVSESVDKVVATPDVLASVLKDAASAGAGDTTIMLAGDVDMTDSAWTSIKVDGYNGAGIVTIDGNGYAISGLTAPLFAGGFAGKSGIVIKNLTIKDSNIVSTSGLGGGAFVDTADSMQVVTLENCHLINSTVSGERTGGLIGWCSGYAKLDDGPVKTYVTISGCSVVDSTVIGAGSAGAIAGHPGASDYTYTTIENCVVKNVDVVSNDSGSWRTGAIVGTANNGHIVINNVTVEDVTLTQNGVVAEEAYLFGRFVPSSTGTLEIDGTPVVANNDDLKAAVAAGHSKILLANGEYDLNGNQKDGLTLVGVGNNVKVANTTKYASGKSTGAIWQAIKLENVTVTDTVYTMADGGKSTFTNVYFAAGFRQGYGTAVVFDGCRFGSNSEGYALHFQTDSASEGGLITLNDCTFEGGKVHLGGKRAYAFNGCEFAEGTDFQVWSNITLENCTVNGEKVTAENMATLFPKLDATKVTLK